MAAECRVLWRAFFGVSMLLLSVAGRAADPLTLPAVRAAVVPQADLVVSVDAAGWNQTAIQKTIDSIKEDMQDGDMPPEALKMQMRGEEILETLGIAKEDLSGFVLSAYVQGITEAEARPSSPGEAVRSLGVVGCFTLSKAITTAAIQKAISRTAAEEGVDVIFEKNEYKGAQTLSVATTGPETADAWMKMFGGELSVALIEDGKVGYVGLAPQVRAAVDRYAGKQPADFIPPVEAARQAVLDRALTYILFIPGDSMRSAAKEQGGRMQQQNPMVAGAMQSVGGLQHVVFGMAGSDVIGAQLSADFSSEQEAMQIKSVLDMMVLGMGKMMIMQSLGRPIPLLESLLSQQDGNRVAVNATLTEEDCRALVELRTKMQNQGPGGAPMPPPPPAN